MYGQLRADDNEDSSSGIACKQVLMLSAPNRFRLHNDVSSGCAIDQMFT